MEARSIRAIALLSLTVGVAIGGASAAGAAPAISNVRSSSDSVGLYGRFELTFDVATVATNLYWPYDEQPNAGVPARVGVTVDGLFSNDDWQTTIVQPAFWFQGFAYSDYESGGHHDDWLYPTGSPCWKIRFAPTALGQWRCKIRVTDAEGTTSYDQAPNAFTCVPSTDRGFVRVSPSDCRYFETSDGRYLSLLGARKSVGTLFEKEQQFATFGGNGVNLLRTWWQGSSEPIVFGLSGQGGLGRWSGDIVLAADVTREGELFSGMISGTGTASTRADVKPSTRYRFSAWVKTVGLVGDPGCGAHLRAFRCVEGDVPLTGSLSGDTDWTRLSAVVTTEPDQRAIEWLKVVVTGASSGATYFADFSLREFLPGGELGPEVVGTPDLNKHRYVSQREAWVADREVEIAKANGVYLKVVLQEKQDVVFCSIQPDGTGGPRSEANFYASPTHAGRTYQQYFWRYIIARYGYATSIHSFELCNEGDPFSGLHTNALAAFSSYFEANDPNKHLCTTSNWHSYPTSEMWERIPSLGYTDWHRYAGEQTGVKPSVVFGWDSPPTWPLDETVYRSEPASLHLSGDGQEEGKLSSMPIPIEPGHLYSFSWYLKGNVSTNTLHPLEWQFPTVCIQFKTGHRGFDTGTYHVPGAHEKLLGEFGWTLRTFQVTAPTDAHYLRLDPSLHWCTGDVWFDDITVRDDTTGLRVDVPNGSFDAPMRGRLDYNTAAMTYSIGSQVGSAARRHIKKPIVAGETGIVGDKIADSITLGEHTYRFTGENQQLVYDVDGVWYRKFVWGHIAPFGFVDLYWWTENVLYKGLSRYAKAYQQFMADIPLSNGGYLDAEAATSTYRLRAWGQKNVANRRAHLWIDNCSHTWKNVVDGVRIEPVSGQVTLDGLPDGTYRVEWRDTSTGSVLRTEEVQCSQGRITLLVTDLASDIACKIGPAPPSIVLTLAVIGGKVISGNEVTIAVDYTNTGAAEAHDAAVTARIPAEMEYVAGSAEATGGTYDPAAKALTWVVGSVAAGATRRFVFKARVN